MTGIARLGACAAVGLATVLGACATDRPGSVALEERRVNDVLDALHDAASRADERGYFGLFASDAVFFGTDATERWTVDEFRAYARPIFEEGRGWTYHPTERNVMFSSDRKIAWFDEMLENASYGECRGTGVLLRDSGRWRIAQYHLTVPIPNSLLPAVVEQIRAQEGTAARQ